MLFFGVPLVLWSLGAVAARRIGRETASFALIAGSDNRLSLSRLQAFLWTLVIFGAYVAAMAINTEVTAEKWIAILDPLLELADLSQGIEELPDVDQTLVILTGLSQGGYLAGKAASNA